MNAKSLQICMLRDFIRVVTKEWYSPRRKRRGCLGRSDGVNLADHVGSGYIMLSIWRDVTFRAVRGAAIGVVAPSAFLSSTGDIGGDFSGHADC